MLRVRSMRGLHAWIRLGSVMSGFLAHRWGAVFVADCGAHGATIAPDEARVTCPACKARPADPALWAERDQFAAALRDVQSGASDD